MNAHALSTSSYEDYLAVEAQAEGKYEFHDGFIVAMAGGTLAHGQIGMNVGRALGNTLELNNKNCRVYSSDVKIHIQATRRTFYPDLSVACGEPTLSEVDPNALINPMLILEVLSESTVDFDRGEKFAHYRRLPSLREYVLVSQNQVLVDSYFRLESGSWEIQTLMDLEDVLRLPSLGVEIAVKDIYHLVPGLAQPAADVQ